MASPLDLQEQEQLDQIKHFWSKWGGLISTLLIVVFGAIAAWNGYQYWQNRQSTQAAILFDTLESAIQSGDMPRIDQAFEDLRQKYGSTTLAAQAGLLVGKARIDRADTEGAKKSLQWVADHASDDGLKALARLRLASVLMNEKLFDQALAQLSQNFPPDFDAVAADRKGDIFVLQEKRTEAIEQYTIAYQALNDTLEYRRLVEVKLNALGVHPEPLSSSVSKDAKL
jgi:predicted negative regulator of RcsB-dependent stress response